MKTPPLPSLVSRAGMPRNAKAVATVLATRANGSGECYPSVKLIAKESAYSAASVYSALSWLERNGVITRTPKYGPHGGRVGTTYRVIREGLSNLPDAADETRTPPPMIGVPSSNDWSTLLQPLEGYRKYSVEVSSRSELPKRQDTAGAVPSEEIDLVRYQEDQGPDVTNPFSSASKHPAGKGRGPRNGRDISTWNNLDVAQEFADQASRFFPMLSNRCNLLGLAKNLKLDRERTGATPEMHVAMIDAFFWDRDRIREGTPLWMQFSGSLARLQDRAMKTLTWDRDTRWGRSVKDPEGTTRVLTPLETQNQWLIAHGMEPLSETESDDD